MVRLPFLLIGAALGPQPSVSRTTGSRGRTQLPGGSGREIGRPEGTALRGIYARKAGLVPSQGPLAATIRSIPPTQADGGPIRIIQVQGGDWSGFGAHFGTRNTGTESHSSGVLAPALGAGHSFAGIHGRCGIILL